MNSSTRFCLCESWSRRCLFSACCHFSWFLPTRVHRWSLLGVRRSLCPLMPTDGFFWGTTLGDKRSSEWGKDALVRGRVQSWDPLPRRLHRDQWKDIWTHGGLSIPLHKGDQTGPNPEIRRLHRSVSFECLTATYHVCQTRKTACRFSHL